MLDMREIEQEIAAIEHAKNHSKSDCIFLAALYSIRDHQKSDIPYYVPSTYSQIPIAYSQAAEPDISAKIEVSGNSEFIRSISGKNTNAIWKVVDELMDTLKLANPRVYDGVIREIQAL